MRIPLLMLPLLGLLIFMLSARPLAAQSTNPSIAEIQANPNSYLERVVTIAGTAGAAVDSNEFLLDDGTGQIVVDPGPPWHRQIRISVGTSVSITGQIDWMEPPGNRRGVDLDACRIVTPTETIEIRDCAFAGPPPWAGNPGRGGRDDRGHPGSDDDWYGIIEQRPTGIAGAWVIGGRTFTATAGTRLDDDDGPLVVGACVSVEFAGNQALEIESEPIRACPR